VISLVDDGRRRRRVIDKDELVSFNGDTVPVAATVRWINAFLEENGEWPITVVLRRGDEEKTLTIKPVVGCAIPVSLEVNAKRMPD